MTKDFDLAGFGLHNPAQTWAYVAKYRQLTKMKLMIKGLETAEDARLAVENGIDGIIVSNHGGRAAESNRGTIDCLPEIAAAVSGQLGYDPGVDREIWHRRRLVQI